MRVTTDLLEYPTHTHIYIYKSFHLYIPHKHNISIHPSIHPYIIHQKKHLVHNAYVQSFVSDNPYIIGMECFQSKYLKKKLVLQFGIATMYHDIVVVVNVPDK